MSNDYQDRVRVELHELNGRIVKLDQFIQSDTFKNLAEEDGELLIAQFNAMCEYSLVLSKRIARFK